MNRNLVISKVLNCTQETRTRNAQPSGILLQTGVTPKAFWILGYWFESRLGSRSDDDTGETKATTPKADQAAGPATPAGEDHRREVGCRASTASNPTSRSWATSTRPTLSASNASRTAFATLLHDNVARPLSIEVAPSLNVAQASDSSAESSLNVARPISIELAPEGFDSWRLSDDGR